MMRTFSLNGLRSFDAAAKALNFGIAAEALHVTQGAVAQQVRTLEASLGVKLFHRHARGLSLTEAGARYHVDVARALSIIEAATDALRPAPARATISVTPSFAAKWLAPRLARFAETHPEIELRTEATEELTSFKADGVDLAVRQGPPPADRGIEARMLAPLDLLILASPDVASRLPAEPAPAELAVLQLVQDDHKYWDAFFAAEGVTAARRPMRFGQTALALDMAREGQGLVIAPRLLAEADVKAGALVILGRAPAPVGFGFHLVAPRLARPSPSREAVVRWLLSEAVSG